MDMTPPVECPRIAPIEAYRHRGKRDLAQPSEQQGLRFRERLVQGRIHRLLDQASGLLAAVADREQFGFAEGLVHVVERDGIEGSFDDPAPAMALLGRYEAALPQSRQRPAYQHGIRPQHAGELFRRERPPGMGHVEQEVEHGRESAVALHATIHVT